MTDLLLQRACHTALIWTGVRSISNLLRYGDTAPRPRQRLSISPADITDRYLQSRNGNIRFGHWRSGQVVDGDWDQSRRPFVKSIKFQSCAAHFNKGVEWKDTKALPYGLNKLEQNGKYDGCSTEPELLARYASLDNLWAKTKVAGALPPKAARNTTLRTGILVHIDRQGQLLFGNQGFHRLAIAKLAKIETMTVVLGIVHPQALNTEAYQTLMKKRP